MMDFVGLRETLNTVKLVILTGIIIFIVSSLDYR